MSSAVMLIVIGAKSVKIAVPIGTVKLPVPAAQSAPAMV